MIRKFADNEDGQGLIEYVLILLLIAMVVIVSVTFLGVALNNYYNNTVNQVVSVGG